MPVPFVLLVVSICAAWLSPLSVGQRLRVHPWAIIYAAAVIAAFAQGLLQVSAVASLIVLVALALWMTRATHKAAYWLAFALLLVLCLALALHKVPGFNNPIVIDGAQFSPDAKLFTQYLNFDKGSVGLVLFALLSHKFRAGDHVGRLFAQATMLVLRLGDGLFELHLGIGAFVERTGQLGGHVLPETARELEHEHRW